MIVPLLGGSFDIAQRQPKIDERIFPYNPKSVSSGFQRVRNELGIEDLRYHDLRREGQVGFLKRAIRLKKLPKLLGIVI